MLTDLTVTLNGVPLVSGTGYTYDGETGVFATETGIVTVPAAQITQGADGVWTVTPGCTVLTVSGSV